MLQRLFTVALVLGVCVSVRLDQDCSSRRSSSLHFRAKSSVNETKQRFVKVDVVSVAPGTESVDVLLDHWTALCDDADAVSLSVSVMTPPLRTYATAPGNVSARTARESTPDVPSTTAPALRCRPGYEPLTGVGCYREGRETLTWEQARLVCEAEGAHLAVPDTQKELDFFIEIYKRPGPSPWAGIKKAGKQWVTVKAEPFGDSGWAPGQPDGKGECVFVWSEGILDWRCSDTLRYICEQHST